MPTMFYVTALAMPKGATEMPNHRTDMAKYFTLADAEAHKAQLQAPHYYDVRVEEREDHEGDGHAHGFKLGELEAYKRLRR